MGKLSFWILECAFLCLLGYGVYHSSDGWRLFHELSKSKIQLEESISNLEKEIHILEEDLEGLQRSPSLAKWVLQEQYNESVDGDEPFFFTDEET